MSRAQEFPSPLAPGRPGSTSALYFPGPQQLQAVVSGAVLQPCLWQPALSGECAPWSTFSPYWPQPLQPSLLLPPPPPPPCIAQHTSAIGFSSHGCDTANGRNLKATQVSPAAIKTQRFRSKMTVEAKELAQLKNSIAHRKKRHDDRTAYVQSWLFDHRFDETSGAAKNKAPRKILHRDRPLWEWRRHFVEEHPRSRFHPQRFLCNRPDIVRQIQLDTSRGGRLDSAQQFAQTRARDQLEDIVAEQRLCHRIPDSGMTARGVHVAAATGGGAKGAAGGDATWQATGGGTARAVVTGSGAAATSAGSCTAAGSGSTTDSSRGVVASGVGVAATGTSNGPRHPGEIATTWFNVHRAPTGVSRCKNTKCTATVIPKYALRIGRNKESGAPHFRTHTEWFHPACAFSALSRKGVLAARINSPSDLNGFDDLNKSDQVCTCHPVMALWSGSCRQIVIGHRAAR